MIRKMEESWKNIPEVTKFALKITFFLGIIVHLFMLTNKLPCHDDLGQIFDYMERSSLGRWFLKYPAAISGELSIVFAGVLGMVYISIAVAILTIIFNIKSKIVAAFMGGVMVSFPTIGGTLFYMNSADAYFFALMLIAIAIYFTVKKDKFSWIVAVLCFTISLGIYQAYYPFAIAILVILHIAMLWTDKFSSTKIVISGLKTIGILLGSVGLYLLKVKYDQVFGNVKLRAYKGVDQMGKISLEELPSLIEKAYTEPLRFFMKDSWRMHNEFISYIFILGLLSSVVLAFYLLSKTKWDKKEKRIRILLMVALLVALPLGAGAIYIMVTERVHLLMVYGYVGLLMFPLILVDKLQTVNGKDDIGKKEIIKKGIHLLESIVLCMICVLFVNYMVLTNQAYFQMNLTYEQSYAYANRLVSRIEQTEGFSKDKTIVLIGKTEVNADATLGYRVRGVLERPLKEQLKRFSGVIDSYVDIGNFKNFLRYYIGVEENIVMITEESQLEEYGIEIDTLNLMNYPENNSITIVDDMVIVKFSEI